MAARTAADGKWVRRTARMAADGVGATEWLEMGGEKKPLVMSELGCADGCGREMGGENCADGCRRHGCKGVAAPEAAGDERAWLRGRLRTGNGRGELRGRLRTAWVQGSGWKWVGRRTRCSPRTRMLTRMLMDMQSLRTIFCNSLFEQSQSRIYTYFPRYQSAVWSGRCRVWSVECKVWSVECKVLSEECKVQTVKCGV